MLNTAAVYIYNSVHLTKVSRKHKDGTSEISFARHMLHTENYIKFHIVKITCNVVMERICMSYG